MTDFVGVGTSENLSAVVRAIVAAAQRRVKVDLSVEIFLFHTIIFGQEDGKNIFVPSVRTNMTSAQGWKLVLSQCVTSYVLECFLHPATPPCYPHKHTHALTHSLHTGQVARATQTPTH